MNQRIAVSLFIIGLALVFIEPASALDPYEATINPGLFPEASHVVRFDEVPQNTFTPFTISDLAFSGDGVILNTNFITSPSGSPAFSTRSTPADFVVISTALPVSGIGAYFNVQGQSRSADLELEIYHDATLLATFALNDFTNSTSSFFGAVSYSLPFNRAIFRNVANNRVSFLMDDVTYFSILPEPTALTLLCFGSICLLRRR